MAWINKNNFPKTKVNLNNMNWLLIILIVIALIIGRGIDKIHDILEEIRDRLPEPYDPDDEV